MLFNLNRRKALIAARNSSGSSGDHWGAGMFRFAPLPKGPTKLTKINGIRVHHVATTIIEDGWDGMQLYDYKNSLTKVSSSLAYRPEPGSGGGGGRSR